MGVAEFRTPPERDTLPMGNTDVENGAGESERHAGPAHLGCGQSEPGPVLAAYFIREVRRHRSGDAAAGVMQTT